MGILSATTSRRFDRLSVARTPKTHWTITLPIDLGLVFATVVGAATEDVVLWFHVIFLLLILAALMFSFRQFVIRSVIGMSVSTALVVWAVSSLDVPSDELTELPLMTMVLAIVFLVAQARSVAAAERESAQRELNARTDQEFVELRRQLQQSQRLEMLGRSTVGLAHDLRNVFVVLQGCADDLQDERCVDHEQTLLDMSMAAARGLDVVDGLLWVGRQHRSERTEVDLHSAVVNLTPLLRRLMRRGVQLVIDAPPHLARVSVDRLALTQILMNLVSNANDAITDPAGRVSVVARIVTTKTAEASDFEVISLSVSDTGDGVDRAVVCHLFDPDFTTKDDSHSGLGLATVWQLVARLDGSVQIETADSGTTVRVTLPIPGERPEDELSPEESRPEADRDRSGQLADDAPATGRTPSPTVETTPESRAVLSPDAR